MLAHWLNQPRFRKSAIALAALGLAALLVLGAHDAWPAIGAQGAEVLRRLLGPEAVAKLETTLFQVQDDVHQWEYRVIGAQPVAPWTTAAGGEPGATPPASAPGSTPVAPSGSAPGWPFGSLGPSSWNLAPVPAAGSLAGAGHWVPYIDNGSGQVVAYRTFVQPDPGRPYTVVAIVAFDLKAAQLHFVLGSQEPASNVEIDRPGTIPAGDFKAGDLLAAFNGGFKAEHGHFGAMVDGITVIPPRPGLGTIAIYSNGQVRMGEWGTDISASPDAVAYRQNGPLLIHNGQINPHTADVSPQDWGYTVGGRTATWRSGLGLSADGRSLYYVAGPSLTLPALAQTLAEAGAAQAVQLDINDYWVHFDTIQPGKSGLQATPLFPSMSAQDDRRYLRGDTRDFFYVTANAG